VSVNDLVRGPVSFAAKDIDDQVLLKSDGFPTYHLANVVDDHLMGITHVIRGEEWLPSTPKHILLYHALGWEPPQFAHLSLFLSKQGGKMSKRHGETSLLAFRNQGYLPAAIINFIALLGWNPKTEEEFFSLDELIRRFDLAMINRANPIFETEKLQWMNHHYLQRLTVAEVIERVSQLALLAGEFSERYAAFLHWFDGRSTASQESIWASLRERSNTLLEVCGVLDWLQPTADYQPEELIWKKSDRNATIQVLAALERRLAEIPPEGYLRAALESDIMGWIAASEWGNGDVLWPMRYALCGQKQSPSPFELAELLGKEESLQRIHLAYTRLAQE
jgi:glutamyl-tRNA synthetase